MIAPKFELPAEVRQLPLDEKIKRLELLAPQKVVALEVLVTAALEDVWREEFRSGPRGGLRLDVPRKGDGD